MEKLFIKSCSERNILTNSSSDIFIKTKNLETNLFGKSPLLIYQKPIKLFNYNLLNKNTDFITDGGLSKKNLILKPKIKKTILKNYENNKIKNQSFSNSAKNIFKNNYTHINNRNIQIINNKILKKNKTFRKKTKISKKSENLIQNNSIENDEIKINNMNKLIENGITNILNDFYSNSNKINKFKENKQKIIQENGIIIKTQTLDSNETENNLSKSSKKIGNRNNSLYKIKKNYTYNDNINILYNNEKHKIKNKRTLKPNIDQFEYLNKISQEQIKIYGHSFYLRNNNHNRVYSNLTNKKNKNKFINNNTFILQNGNNNITFRKGKSSSNLFECKKKYPHKYSYEELCLFLRQKKIKKRKKIEKEENEKSKNFFRIFNNLFNLCMKETEDSSKLNNDKTNKSNLSNEKNKNYLRNNKTIIRNNNYSNLFSFKTESTIVEPSNYLLKIFECQKILNNDFESKKINNNINQEIFNNNNNDISIDIEKVNETLNKTNLIINGKQINNLINNENINNNSNNNKNNINNNIKENKENINNIDVNLNYNNQIKSSSNSNSNEYIINNTIVSSKKNVSIEIDSKLIINLIKTIKIIYKRKIFYLLYEIYLFDSILERYNIAISFFIAILKFYPFKKIKENNKI